MSDTDDDDSKQFEPTEKKLNEAAERGDVPVSREAALLGALGAMLAVCSLTLRDGAARLADTLAHLFEDPARWRLRNGADAAELIGLLLGASAQFVVPIFVIFLVAGLAVSFAQNAPSVALDRIAPKLSKISPAAGLSRLIGKKGAVEFLKSVFKLLAMGLVAALVLNAERGTVADTLFVSPAVIPDRILSLLVKLLSGVTAAFLIVAVADYAWTKISWRKRMMMTRQEVKDEHKQNEGDPHMKAKRRSLALDRRRRRMMADVPRATLVIANPTHFSIALRYKREEGGAPVVIAKGQDLLALRIREIAAENGIAVVENKPLARSMYDLVEVGELIPPEFYKAVAEVIHYIQTRDKSRPTSPASTVLH
ncbi:flagellar biosynthesis protein FlhB [Lichenibacterium ramalinae]|uniref:Flagellar biosynthetic protein FlhB n=1 Tax=Lichenibacterium ramalinae TaxID=2316527 RepID=A0A4Q2RAR4_9HYPH|nr:flagellar biosynthesis protein FlhB [Lichenibacterium ramalinae]RYB03033.1 flagellar biosynthesis protein FlhB [Lichenibacterium ramalinae]